MFDGHIQYYAYNNLEGDDFGVGYLGNKEFWVGMVNRWAKEDGKQIKYTNEMFDEIRTEDFRGCLLAEVEYDNLGTYNVVWFDDDNENAIQINGKWEILWTNNPQSISSIPRWATRLKNILKEQEN